MVVSLSDDEEDKTTLREENEGRARLTKDKLNPAFPVDAMVFLSKNVR